MKFLTHPYDIVLAVAYLCEHTDVEDDGGLCLLAVHAAAGQRVVQQQATPVLTPTLLSQAVNGLLKITQHKPATTGKEQIMPCVM